MPLLSQVPEDRVLSPVTGWTRAHWLAAADDLLLAVRPWATPGFGRIDLPGEPARAGWTSDGLEGFARTFLVAAFRVAGTGGEDPHGHLAHYRRGLLAGTRTPGWTTPSRGPPSGPSTTAAAHGGVRLGRPRARPHTGVVVGRTLRPRAGPGRGLVARQPAPRTRAEQLVPVPPRRGVLPHRRRPRRRRDGAHGRPRPGTPRGLVPGRGLVLRRRRPDVRPLRGLGDAPVPGAARAPAGGRRTRAPVGGRLREFLEVFARTFDANGARCTRAVR